jgi:hypothetical protein
MSEHAQNRLMFIGLTVFVLGLIFVGCQALNGIKESMCLDSTLPRRYSLKGGCEEFQDGVWLSASEGVRYNEAGEKYR